MNARPRKRQRRLQNAAEADVPEGIRCMGVMLADNHPRLVKLARDFATDIFKIRHDSQRPDGTLEIELCFGRGTGNAFSPLMAQIEAQLVLTACDRGMAEWSEKEGKWNIYYDTFLRVPESTEIIRVRSINGEKPVNVTKTRIARLDLEATAIPDLSARLQAKVEREVPEKSGMMLLQSESVRVSTRRSFVIRSGAFPDVQYRYTVIQAWSGRTAKEAERDMQEGKEAQTSIEVEVELDWARLDERKIMFVCLSLLMKAQDIVEVLSGDRSVRKVRNYAYKDAPPEPKRRRAKRKSKSKSVVGTSGSSASD